MSIPFGSSYAWPQTICSPAGTRSPGSRAFSLIELLSVMAIVGMLAVASVPAMNSINGAGRLSKAATDIGSTLEQARSYAMANNTYVFVGFSEVDGLSSDSGSQTSPGTGRVVVVVASSKDGSKSMAATNLVALLKPRKFDNMHVVDPMGSSALPNSGNLARPVVDSASNIGSGQFTSSDVLQWPIGTSGAPVYSFAKIVQIDPNGTASSVQAAGDFSKWMEIGLVEAKGNTVPLSANGAVVLLDGVTGSVKIYRP